MKRFFFIPILLLVFITSSFSQILNPAKWTFDKKYLSGDQYELSFTVKLDEGWNVYSQYLESDDGPIRTSFNYDNEIKAIGKNQEISDNRIEGFDDIFEMNVIKFKKSVTFKQKVEVTDPSEPITGYLTFMVCDAERCLPPKDVDFEFSLEGLKPSTSATNPPKEETKPAASDKIKDNPTKDNKDSSPSETSSVSSDNKTKENTKPTTTKTDDSKTKATDKKEDLATIEENTTTDTEATTSNYDDSDSGILNPVKWEIAHQKTGDSQYVVRFKATLDDKWTIYSQYLESDDGPVKTQFYFDNTKGVKSLEDAKEISDHKKSGMDDVFGMNVVKYSKEVIFEHRLELPSNTSTLIGEFEYMVCDDTKCLPPKFEEFNLDLSKDSDFVALVGATSDTGNSDTGTESKFANRFGEDTPIEKKFDRSYKNESCPDLGIDENNKSLWYIFVGGFIGGLLALLTPCVFPMIPLTVSFFLKDKKQSRYGGIRKGITYALSIIFIYTTLGVLITSVFGAGALNEMSSNPWFNFAFFLILFFFGLSFLGYYEITLPSSWANKTDRMADKGGLIGIFFMAAALAIVSFSCTGPLIGTLLVESVSSDGEGFSLAPTVGMLGFSLALGLPFGIFAAFPSFLNSMPKSGGWMNDVKVVIGIIEIALSLKFLTVADQIWWTKGAFKLLPYEAFLGIWILLCLILNLYMFGVIKFHHAKVNRSIMRSIVAIAFLAFGAYLAQGFIYKPKTDSFTSLNAISGVAPPVCRSYVYDCEDPEIKIALVKDFFEAEEIAKKEGKPVLIDFTGYACENCRRMEEQVWGKPSVLELLAEKFVIASLYVDDREKLSETYKSKFFENKVRTKGQLWTDFQMTHFDKNSQPTYVVINTDGVILNQPVGYTPNAADYRAWLNCGLEGYEKLKEE